MVYKLLIDEGKKKKFAYAKGVTDWPQQLIKCTECGREWYKSLMHKFGTNIPVVLLNEYYPDFAWYYIVHISERAKSIMETEKITGFILEEAQILSVLELTEEQRKELRYDGFNVKKIPECPPKFYKLHVSIGAEYHEKSKIMLKESCKQCGYELYITEGKDWVDSEQGSFLKQDSLKGFDLFKAKGYGNSIFCTDRFKQVYIKYNLTGLLFKEVEVL